MTRYLVVRITKNVANYPECREDTERFPSLVRFVRDEMETFIVNSLRPGDFYRASEFFEMHRISSFTIP